MPTVKELAAQVAQLQARVAEDDKVIQSLSGLMGDLAERHQALAMLVEDLRERQNKAAAALSDNSRKLAAVNECLDANGAILDKLPNVPPQTAPGSGTITLAQCQELMKAVSQGNRFVAMRLIRRIFKLELQEAQKLINAAVVWSYAPQKP